MSRYIVDIHGEIDGDFDIIGKYVEPTADVVEVVRCGDCLYHDECSRNVALLGGYEMYGDIDYCSYGERREHEQIH